LSWFEPGFAHHQSQDCQGTRSEVPPKLRAIADEVIVLLFAAVHMSLPGISRPWEISEVRLQSVPKRTLIWLLSPSAILHALILLEGRRFAF
jgi:hypothetical protein